MQNKAFRLGPVALTNTLATNIFSPPTTTGGAGVSAMNTFVTIKHLRFVNTTGAPVAVSLWLGASAANAAGTEVMPAAKVVPGNDSIDVYTPGLRIEVGQFLVGGGGTTGVTMTGIGEIGIA